jgi:hypothetical protein
VNERLESANERVMDSIIRLREKKAVKALESIYVNTTNVLVCTSPPLLIARNLMWRKADKIFSKE